MPPRNLKIYGPSEEISTFIQANNSDAQRLIHIGVHNSANRNAGDTLLFPVVRRAFDHVLGPFNWELRQAWEPFTTDTAAEINKTADAIVLGGGGLLLRDQVGSDVSNSGWQWNSTVDGVNAIELPLNIFAIGYNRFRGQPDFDSIFSKHIQAVVDKSAFFGLRNNGSIRAVSEYLPKKLIKKLCRQFCPTMVIWQLYPDYRARAEAHDAREQHVLAFNAAFDRAKLRFGEQADDVLLKLAQAVRKAEQHGWDIVVAAHKTMDRDIEAYLDRAGVNYDTVDLTDASPDEVLAFYAEIDFAFGMRGHAQMIPFGLRRPIMSIISHDKMRFLLEDINKPEWGVEVAAPDIAERLLAMLNRVVENGANLRAEISDVQERVWAETQSNLKMIGQQQFNIKQAVLYER